MRSRPGASRKDRSKDGARRRPRAAAPAIETGSIRLLDRTGRVRAVLEASTSGAALSMFDPTGAAALVISLSRNGPSLCFSDGVGRTRLFLGVPPGGARIGLADAAGLQRLFLGVSSVGAPTLTLYDGAQRRVWRVPGTGSPARAARRTAVSRGTRPGHRS